MPMPDSTFTVSTDDAVATLWLDRATFTPARVLGLADRAEQLARRSAVEVLVLRATHPTGFPTFDSPFLRDLRSDTDAADYARAGQSALRRLTALPIPTVAFLEGPCIGPGFELALACDYRLAVATPDATLGLGDRPTAWGGRTRLARLIGRRTAARFVSCYPREAVSLGLADDAFCQRRAKIDLRTFLDGLLFRPRKRAVSVDVFGEAEERKRFRMAVRDGEAEAPELPAFDPVNPIPVAPRRVGVLGRGPDLRRWVAEFALRGVPVMWMPSATAPDPFAESLLRGRVTPLEAEQAASRVTPVSEPDDALTADLVLIDDTDDTGADFLERVMPARSVLLLPTADVAGVLANAVRPGRVLGWRTANGRTVLSRPDDATDDATARAYQWLTAAGESVEVRQLEAIPAAPLTARSKALAAVR